MAPEILKVVPTESANFCHLTLQPFSPSPQRLGQHVQENRRGFQGFSNPLSGVRLVTHVYVGSAQVFRRLRMAGFAEWSHQFSILIAPGNVMLFKARFSSTLKASQLVRSSGEPPRCLNGGFVNHDDTAGTA